MLRLETNPGRGLVLGRELKRFLLMDQPPKKRPKVDPSGADGSDHSHASDGPEAGATVDEYHLRESDVGISEYISAHPGFFGILKQRSSSWSQLS